MKSIGNSLMTVGLFSASFIALALPAPTHASVQVRQATVCAGEKKCAEEKTIAAVKAMLAKQKDLYKKIKAENDAAYHYECYGESADPFADSMKNPDVTVMLGSSDNESEFGSSETIYTNEVIVSVALPKDCSEGGIIHNWAPRAVFQLTLEEKVTSGHAGHDTSKFQIKLK